MNRLHKFIRILFQFTGRCQQRRDGHGLRVRDTPAAQLGGHDGARTFSGLDTMLAGAPSATAVRNPAGTGCPAVRQAAIAVLASCW